MEEHSTPSGAGQPGGGAGASGAASDAPAPLPSGPAAPRQLPRAATHFTDRTVEITRLDAAAHANNGLTVVSGQAGVGKSALAVWWAHRMKDRFPDGQLYTDLRGYHTLPPQRPEEALHSFLLALNSPMDNLLGHLDAMSARFRSLLHGKRVLIVADNARNAEQIVPLLPGTPECCVVVTSRSDLSSLAATHGASRVPLRPLPQRDAVELFSRVSGQSETQQVATLIRQCGRLPLTVRIVAQRSQAPDDIADLIEDLTDPRERLAALNSADEETGMRLVLSWSYNGLTPEKAHAFRLLALHAGPDFSPESAAALLGVRTGAALRLLRALKSDNLLEEVSDRRFRFHDLVRDYAQERVLAEEPEAVRDAAIRRELRFYLHCCDSIDRVLAPQRQHVPLDEEDEEGGPLSRPVLGDHTSALAWCDAEIVSLAAAVDQAAQRRMHDMAWKIPIALIYYFVVRHHHTYRHDLSAIALRAARLSHNTWAEIWAEICLGGATGEVGKHAEAAAHFTNALNLSTRTGDLKWESIARYNLAWTLRVAGRYEEAYIQQKQALERHTDEANQRSQAISLNELATISLVLDRPQRALDHLLAALPLCREAEDLLTEAAVLHQMGEAGTRLEDRTSALDWYGQAVAIRRRADDRPGLAESLMALGRLRIESNLDVAREALTEALKIMELLKDPRAEEVRDLLNSIP
ncbi:tetratricopeptide repeat protein [Streptomyces sp. NPDC005811]|uniref:ATP-binding protein n=1 Tax=Streptomyces sp. NPDC005811 TaxID=3154565 RepID=UPI0033E81D95